MLNVEKTESASVIDMSGELITTSPFERYLDPFFDSNLKMDKHIDDLVRRGNYQIRRIAKIRK